MNLLRSPKSTFSLLAIGLIIIVSLIIYLNTGWPFYLIWLVTLSAITFILYGFDKGQAMINGLRVPEIVLHGLSLMGGFPGGWLGRMAFRHKTRHVVFTIVLAASTVLHLAGVIWYFRPR